MTQATVFLRDETSTAYRRPKTTSHLVSICSGQADILPLILTSVACARQHCAAWRAHRALTAFFSRTSNEVRGNNHPRSNVLTYSRRIWGRGWGRISLAHWQLQCRKHQSEAYVVILKHWEDLVKTIMQHQTRTRKRAEKNLTRLLLFAEFAVLPSVKSVFRSKYFYGAGVTLTC